MSNETKLTINDSVSHKAKTASIGAITAFILAVATLLHVPAIDRLMRKLEPAQKADGATKPPSQFPPDVVESQSQLPTTGAPPDKKLSPTSNRKSSPNTVRFEASQRPSQVNLVDRKPLNDSLQHCEVGSVCIGRDNNGLVDIHLDKAKKRAFSPESTKQLHDDLLAGSSGHLTVYLPNAPSLEEATFADQVSSIFSASGWSVDKAHGSFAYRSISGTSWVWEGRGFVCALYLSSDRDAAVAIRGLKKAGFPCHERPGDAGVEADGLSLLVGSRGSSTEEDE